MTSSRALKNVSDPAEFQAIIDRRRRDRMNKIDGLSPQLRELVHEYGWNVVSAFLQIGVTKHNHIQHLVETVLNEFSPTRGASSSQGSKRNELTQLDDRAISTEQWDAIPNAPRR